ncbi:MAG: endo-1,4-beta-xylanase [Chitinispirillia bacterium]|nr:endo-1,4-beta-xylanase [Chitinispirillia bacterium]
MVRNRLMPLIMSAAAGIAAFGVPAQAQPVQDGSIVLIRDDFEVNYDGWAETGGFTKLTALAEAAYSSSRGMKVSGRTSPADGAFSEKGFYLDGGERYAYSVFVRHGGKSTEKFTLTLRWLFPDGVTYGSEAIASADVKPGVWAELSAAYTAPPGTVNLTVFLAANSASDFYFDEFTVTGSGKLPKAAAVPANPGLKDVFANKLRNVGTCVPASGAGNSTNTAIILREFNSLTPENELKPDATIQQSGSTNTNVSVSLSRAASILKFAVDNNLSVRGHTLVWHSQTPAWFFREGFQASGAVVSSPVMDQRMDSYIKNMFAAIAAQYPTLKLYAYDVVNEAMSESGGPRTAGSDASNGQSMWVQVYGGNSFVKKAFESARKYAPAGCKLYYNDYNEYITAKRDGIISTIVRPLYNDGLLDAMGMQSHLDVRAGNDAYPSASSYGQAIDLYAAIGVEVQVTELDATVNNQNFTAQATYYKDIVNAILTRGGTNKVTGMTIWGTMDNMSWRKDRHPLLFNENGTKKLAYDAIAALVPQSEWGDGSGGGTVEPPPPIEPDKDGFFFRHTFEDNTAQGWEGRGAATAAPTNAAAANGARSLLASGRTAEWNGAGLLLDIRAFAPGGSYSFSVAAMHSGGAVDTFKLTMQYTLNDSTRYSQVAAVPAPGGQWVQLANTNFAIPTGATGMLLYVEMPGSLSNFYIDNASGAVGGTTIGLDGAAGGTSSALTAQSAVRGPSKLVTLKGRTLTVNVSPGSEVRVRVVNPAGKTAASFNARGGASLSLQKLPAGAYIIEATTDGRRMASSVILR